MKILGLDVGVQTGLCVMDDKFHVHHLQTLELSWTLHVRTHLLLTDDIDAVVVEYPVLDSFVNSRNDLRRAVGEIRIGISHAHPYLKVVEVTPGRWKNVPIDWDEITFKDPIAYQTRTAHSKDAIGICSWYLKFGQKESQ